jgi:hypothetical protein
MFPAVMPWPMTLAPMNEAIRRENLAEKNLFKNKSTATIQEVIEDVRMVLLSKKRYIL